VSRAPALAVVAVADSRAALARELATLRASARRLALVPTMGALHEGHLALVDRARTLADAVVMSVFVNPLQFGPNEDFRTYPRTLDRDVLLAAERGTRLVFAPDERVMYPRATPDIQVDPGQLADRLCGAFRPGHFRGVLTVVAKLFGLVRPEVAIFGRKDYQQALLIRRMVEDLDLGVSVDVAPTIREEDGLALSSRNAYLSAAERADAPGLWRALDAADRAFRSGETRSALLLEAFRATLGAHPSLTLQYVEIVHPDTLTPLESAMPGAVMAVAAFCGSTRLIDNVILGAAADPRIAAGSRV
jgi:pantoate--beta-alanine ligase